MLSTAVGPVVISGGSGLHFRAVVDPLRFPGEDRASTGRHRGAFRPPLLEARLLEIDPEQGITWIWPTRAGCHGRSRWR